MTKFIRDVILSKLFRIELKAWNLCNNIQGFERWFGASSSNRIDLTSLEPIELTNEWFEIINEYDLVSGSKFANYDIRKINVKGITDITRIQFTTSDNEIFESLVTKDGFYIIDVEPLKKGTSLHARYVSNNKQRVQLFISIIKI